MHICKLQKWLAVDETAAALQSCDKEQWQQHSLIVKSRIGRRHASNLGLYFSHFRSDDKALGLSFLLLAPVLLY